jgi:hypothetical protein
MAKFNLDDYQPVEDRLRAFYEQYPDGRVITELVYQDAERCIIKTSLYRDHNPETPVWATGFAEEVKTDRGVNATSYVENCETSSTGRALANANFAPKGKRPSREEMTKAARREAAPAFTPDQVDTAAGYANAVGLAADVAALKQIWDAAHEAQLLDVVLPEGQGTLRQLIVGRKAAIEEAA